MVEVEEVSAREKVVGSVMRNAPTDKYRSSNKVQGVEATIRKALLEANELQQSLEKNAAEIVLSVSLVLNGTVDIQSPRPLLPLREVSAVVLVLLVYETTMTTCLIFLPDEAINGTMPMGTLQ
jgi:hypothetical protein